MRRKIAELRLGPRSPEPAELGYLYGMVLGLADRNAHIEAIIQTRPIDEVWFELWEDDGKESIDSGEKIPPERSSRSAKKGVPRESGIDRIFRSAGYGAKKDDVPF